MNKLILFSVGCNFNSANATALRPLKNRNAKDLLMMVHSRTFIFSREITPAAHKINAMFITLQCTKLLFSCRSAESGVTVVELIAK